MTPAPWSISNPAATTSHLANFYARQSDSDLAQIEAVSMDVASAYTEATRNHVPHAVICYDPFHIMRWANRALDAVYSKAITGRGRASMTPAQWRTGRWALRTACSNSITAHRQVPAPAHAETKVTQVVSARRFNLGVLDANQLELPTA